MFTGREINSGVNTSESTPLTAKLYPLSRHLKYFLELLLTWFGSAVVSAMVDSPTSEVLLWNNFWMDTGVAVACLLLFFFADLGLSPPGGRFMETSPDEKCTDAWRGDWASPASLHENKHYINSAKLHPKFCDFKRSKNMIQKRSTKQTPVIFSLSYMVNFWKKRIKTFNSLVLAKN